MLDTDKHGEGGLVNVTGGGLHHQFVNLTFVSKPGKGMSFDIKLFGYCTSATAHTSTEQHLIQQAHNSNQQLNSNNHPINSNNQQPSTNSNNQKSPANNNDQPINNNEQHNNHQQPMNRHPIESNPHQVPQQVSYDNINKNARQFIHTIRLIPASGAVDARQQSGSTYITSSQSNPSGWWNFW